MLLAFGNKGVKGLQPYPQKKALSQLGASGENRTSLVCGSRQGINVGNEAFQGEQFKTGPPRMPRTLQGWPLGACLPPWPVLEQCHLLKKLGSGHPKLRSRD